MQVAIANSNMSFIVFNSGIYVGLLPYWTFRIQTVCRDRSVASSGSSAAEVAPLDQRGQQGQRVAEADNLVLVPVSRKCHHFPLGQGNWHLIALHFTLFTAPLPRYLEDFPPSVPYQMWKAALNRDKHNNESCTSDTVYAFTVKPVNWSP